MGLLEGFRQDTKEICEKRERDGVSPNVSRTEPDQNELSATENN